MLIRKKLPEQNFQKIVKKHLRSFSPLRIFSFKSFEMKKVTEKFSFVSSFCFGPEQNCFVHFFSGDEKFIGGKIGRFFGRSKLTDVDAGFRFFKLSGIEAEKYFQKTQKFLGKTNLRMVFVCGHRPKTKELL